jgi:transposase
MSYSLLVGIDWADKCHDVCLIAPDGEKLEEFEVDHTGDGFVTLVGRLLRRVDDPSRVAVVLERPNGPEVETLVERGFHVYHLNPKQSDRFRDRHCVSGAKDDRLDAYVLADAARTDLHKLRRVRLDDPIIVQLRELSRLDDALGNEQVRLTNRLRDQLRRYYPQMLELVSAADEAWLWDLWELAPSPQAALRLKSGRVNQLLRRNRIRRYSVSLVIQALHATPVTVAPGVVEAAQSHIRILLPQLRLVTGQRYEVDKQMKSLLKALSEQGSDDEETKEHRDVTLILSLPGVGTKVAATMLAEASQPLAERDYHSLRRYCGAAPVTEQSGRRRDPTNPKKRQRNSRVLMRRACSKRLRQAVYHWSRVSVQRDPRSRAHYSQLRSKGQTHGRALRTIADRNLKMLTAILRSGKPYDPALRQLSNRE